MKTIPFISVTEAEQRINRWADAKQAFFFIFDYELNKAIALLQSDVNPSYIRYHIGKHYNYDTSLKQLPEQIEWQPSPISYADYQQKCSYVKQEIQAGNSFLVNLTQPTPVKTNLSLELLYNYANATFKVWIKDTFVVLSPEPFVRIQGLTISSFPMKGTIDASIPDAEKLILANPKEEAEHATIVDLIRNDLSIIASDVHIRKYRYIEKLHTLQKNLLQVSSEIMGTLPKDYQKQLGTLLLKLLPAGSISGAPKAKTRQIIATAEGYQRGFYTGICGFYDGENLDSGVMIRFLEQQGEKMVYKSGGGITANSDIETEYQELINKVYVPIR
ncbi:MAG: aminodeoxychorismate synthase component I [Paludibacteraceae bacterium]|nr:aminodeoxychorismate synthase component I [Paludibacteraceae bacterium]MBP6284588.1 aminodeoxychorismate synthase component I [Paludibacteraceae bacterium]